MQSDTRRLTIEFATEEAFRSEYARNIAKGGIFVASDEDFELREEVELEIVLGYCEQSLVLTGEIVHWVPAALASSGATPGVAVQIQSTPAELRSVLEPIAGELENIVDERATQTGRRAAPRSPARVPARLRFGDDQQIETRTRNLSNSGALLSVDGAPASVGDSVKLGLTHPTTGQEIEVPGHVVRKVEDEVGAVTAMGVEFQLAGSRQAEVSRFVNDVRAAEHSRRLGGIMGPISELGIENLLQMFGICAPEGTLTVVRGAEEGTIAFEAGSICSARIGGVSGNEALARMLGWTDGTFEFQARVDPELLDDQEPVPIEGALLEALRHVDECRAIDLNDLQPDAKLRVVHKVADALGDDSGKIEQAILDLAAVGMTVAKVVDVVPEADADIYDALRDLIERGAVQIRTS